ncbi:Mob1/phocein [Westerdykella ornata]|uniref:Mob1/phocein n=1 Tax=Westerdykella ornata TaxID=318751 RepID=A0A6A6JJQ2_WESOR|nr:Mob1/phocein [Westerdykella ornata]KAF2276821.1 Mob1/phocein [Westerdykella ornata]
MSFTARSPSSSPRLPSPPPIPEDQLGPKSPLLAAAGDQQMLSGDLDTGSGRRIRPGAKAEEVDQAPNLPDIEQLNPASEPRDWLEAKYRSLTHPDPHTTTAINREKALQLAVPPKDVDKTIWLYELCRFITKHTNSVLTGLFRDDPPCSSATCPEMRASEWQYLCAVHEPPKPCCAIDYCCHTLDWAANLLSSTKIFPSRLGQGVDQNSQHQQVRHLTNIFRRVYRIFAHAWFQHREVFWQVEGRSGLYMLLKTICDHYGLIPDDSYTIPPEAEGEDAPQAAAAAAPEILKRDKAVPGGQEAESGFVESAADHTLSTAGTTKRHRHSPSTAGSAVSTVIEETEEEESMPAKGTGVAAQETSEPAGHEATSSETAQKTQASSIVAPPSSTEAFPGYNAAVLEPQSHQPELGEVEGDAASEETREEEAAAGASKADEKRASADEAPNAEATDAQEVPQPDPQPAGDAETEAEAKAEADADAAAAQEKEEFSSRGEGKGDSAAVDEVSVEGAEPANKGGS